MSCTPAQRRYNGRALVLSAIYAGALLTSVGFFRHYPSAAQPSAYLFAAMPALPIVGMVVVLARYLIEERDEYLRMLRIRQALIATGLTLGIVTVWGFVEDAGLAPHVPAFYVAVLWFAGFATGAFVNKLIERDMA